MGRDEVEQELLRRHPCLPPGLVISVAAQSARRQGLVGARGAEDLWPLVLHLADVRLAATEALRCGERSVDGGHRCAAQDS